MSPLFILDMLKHPFPEQVQYADYIEH
jgi:hypothetical protein